MNSNRPVYLNLFKIRLPITGIVSLAHRVSGIALFLAIPCLVYILDLTTRSRQDFQLAVELLDHPVVIAINFMLLWALLHHFFAGLRFLLIDFDIGDSKQGSSNGAAAVIVLELAVLCIFLVAWL